ncbi:hypothetical protein DBR45_02995, partial [Pseudomonas sp. HMWF031]
LCRSELAREELKDAALILSARVIVGDPSRASSLLQGGVVFLRANSRHKKSTPKGAFLSLDA